MTQHKHQKGQKSIWMIEHRSTTHHIGKGKTPDEIITIISHTVAEIRRWGQLSQLNWSINLFSRTQM